MFRGTAQLLRVLTDPHFRVSGYFTEELEKTVLGFTAIRGKSINNRITRCVKQDMLMH